MDAQATFVTVPFIQQDEYRLISCCFGGDFWLTFLYKKQENLQTILV